MFVHWVILGLILNTILMLYFIYQYFFGIEIHNSKYTQNIELIKIREDIDKILKLCNTIIEKQDNKGKNE